MVILNISILFCSFLFSQLNAMEKIETEQNIGAFEQFKQLFCSVNQKFSQKNITNLIAILKQDPQDPLIKDAASMLLHSLIRNANPPMQHVQDLLEIGADSDFKDAPKSRSTLAWAVHNNHIEAAALMLTDKNVNSKITPEMSLLTYVASNSEFNHFAKLLIKHGARTNDTHRAPLYSAIEGNNPELSCLLLEEGAQLTSLDITFIQKTSPMLIKNKRLLETFLKTHCKQSDFYEDCLMPLLSNILEVDDCDALHCLYPYYSGTHYSEQGARNCLLPSAVHLNAQKSVTFLLSNFNNGQLIKDILKKMKIENHSIVTDLIKHYITTAETSLPFSFIEEGVENNNVPLVQAILENDETIDITQKDLRDQTLLMTALKTSPEIGHAILNNIKTHSPAGGNARSNYINKKESYSKNTALHYAAQYQNIKAVVDLLELEADDLTENKDGAIPLNFAQSTGNGELIKVLQNHAYKRRALYLSND